MVCIDISIVIVVYGVCLCTLHCTTYIVCRTTYCPVWCVRLYGREYTRENVSVCVCVGEFMCVCVLCVRFGCVFCVGVGAFPSVGKRVFVCRCYYIPTLIYITNTCMCHTVYGIHHQKTTSIVIVNMVY